MKRFFAHVPNLEVVLWLLATVIAAGIFLIFVPGFLSSPSAAATPPMAALATLRPTFAPLPSATPIPPPPPPKVQSPRPVPTPPPGAKLFSFVADVKRSGWFATGETNPHWGDRNMHAGTYKGQTFQSLLYFDLPALAPGSKILFAQVEIAGLSRSNLGPSGEWTLKAVPSDSPTIWIGRSNNEFRNVATLGNIGAPLGPADLAEGQTNQFVFSADQITLVERAANTTGQLAFRLDGPSSGESLFSWDGGDAAPKQGVHPMLRVIAVPAEYVFITNTPTPQNVMTAAAVLVQNTLSAQRYGTPTPFPRSYATAVTYNVVTPVPTPANLETASVQASYATAVAITTGTFTPTPLNWITATPAPTLAFVIPAQDLTPTPTATPTPTRLTPQQLAKRPLPSTFYNKILFLSGSRQSPSVWVIDPDGKNLGILTDSSTYYTATARDTISPGGANLAFNAPDHDQPDILQIWLLNLNSPSLPPQQVTFLHRGFAFAPAWSPDGTKIAYVSSETRQQEIFVLDLDARGTKQVPFNTTWSKQITFTADWFWTQFPSWSPDGKQIVFSSDREHTGSFTELWIMNADGSSPRKLGDGTRDAWAPVWVKWKN